MGEGMLGLPVCHEVARRLASGEIEQVSWHKRLLVRTHLLLMCRLCSRYAKQLQLLGDAFRNQRETSMSPEAFTAVKKRLRERLLPLKRTQGGLP